MILSIPGSGTIAGYRYGYNAMGIGYGYESYMSRVMGTGPRPGPWVQCNFIPKMIYLTK